MARDTAVEATASEVGEELEVAPRAKVPATIPDDDGLEDIDDSDLTIPRITIDHKLGVFKDSQTNEEFDSFECIILGLVKQRVLWPPSPGEDGEGPMCRAVDNVTGAPDLAKWLVKHNGVTAQAQSGFSISEVEEGNLPCANCGLKEWDSNPNNGTPWCNEQFTFPVIRIMENGDFAPALISFQRTGLKPCKAYISGFKTSKRPLYTAITRISATHQRKGTVEYVTPSFTRVGDSDPSEYANYSKSLHDIRGFITTPRTFEEETTAVAAPAKAPAKAAAPEPEEEEEEETPAPVKTKAPAAPVIEEDDEDEPF